MTWRYPLIASLALVLQLVSLPAHATTDGVDRFADSLANPRLSRSNVLDPGAVLSPSERDAFQAIANAIEEKTTVQIALVVLKDTRGLPLKDLATRLLQRWGVGQKGEDNGLLILHALDQRRVEVEVGYGLEGWLPDITVNRLLQSAAVPHLKAGRAGMAHLGLIQAIQRHLEESKYRTERIPMPATQEEPELGPVGQALYWVLVKFVAVVKWIANIPWGTIFGWIFFLVLLIPGGFNLLEFSSQARERSATPKGPEPLYELLTQSSSSLRWGARLLGAALWLLLIWIGVPELGVVGFASAWLAGRVLYSRYLRRARALVPACSRCAHPSPMRRLGRKDRKLIQSLIPSDRANRWKRFDVFSCEAGHPLVFQRWERIPWWKSDLRSWLSIPTGKSSEPPKAKASAPASKPSSSPSSGSRSSSSSGSSSGSDTFGGGRSGGGGAGTSY